MAARKLTAKERRELPSRAFGIPSSRKYPVMVLNRSGEAVPSKGHAVDAKGRAEQELEKGRIDSRQYKQIVRKADAAIREIDRARKKAKRNPSKKKVAKKKVVKRKPTRRRKNPSDPVGAGIISREEYDDIVVSLPDLSDERLLGDLKNYLGSDISTAHDPERMKVYIQLFQEERKRRGLPLPRANPKHKATRRRKNPSEADHERVGMEALRNSHEYWEGYMADKSKTNLLVDAYKFLVIAHEELKYAGDAEPRLEADHMLKAAHKELSKKLK